jgi:hypothetical protein
MKVLPSIFNGTLFRSRLEARWAIYFHTANIRWLYEPESYCLDNGIWYVPDFYLPELDCFVEVKPQNEIEGDFEQFQKAFDLFASLQRCNSKSKVLLLDGYPRDEGFMLLGNDDTHADFQCWCLFDDERFFSGKRQLGKLRFYVWYFEDARTECSGNLIVSIEKAMACRFENGVAICN